MHIQLSEQEKKAEDNSLIKGAPFKDIIHPLKLNIEFYRKSKERMEGETINIAGR